MKKLKEENRKSVVLMLRTYFSFDSHRNMKYIYIDGKFGIFFPPLYFFFLFDILAFQYVGILCWTSLKIKYDVRTSSSYFDGCKTIIIIIIIQQPKKRNIKLSRNKFSSTLITCKLIHSKEKNLYVFNF